MYKTLKVICDIGPVPDYFNNSKRVRQLTLCLEVILVLILLQGIPGPPGPIGSKGKAGPTGMKVNVKKHIFFFFFLIATWVSLRKSLLT